MKFLKIISNIILVYVLIVYPTSCRIHSKVFHDINGKSDITETIYNYADIYSTEEVKNQLFHSFSWKNVDNDGIDYYGTILIRFVLTSEYGVENIRIGPHNLNQSIRKEIIRCIKNIDFREIMNSTNVKEKINFIFPFNLHTSSECYDNNEVVHFTVQMHDFYIKNK